MMYYLYANNMQGIKHGKPTDVLAILSAQEACASEACSWCASRRLQLNDVKTELLGFGSAANLHKLTINGGTIRVGQSVMTPVTVVRDLGVMIDAELSMREHVSG